MAQELATAKTQLESALVKQRQEMTDLAVENERQGADIEDRINAEVTLRAELAILQGRIEQTEGELAHARRETIDEREDAAKARIELAKALLRLEAMPRLEADLTALREELKIERQERTAATQQAAVFEAKLEAACERAVQAEAFSAEVRAAVVSRDATPRESAQIDGTDRRRRSKPRN